MTALAQTLHGYDHGHRLLAHGGDLAEDELAILDRLSDLSGYLPAGVDFDDYLTGFPCGRYYALARTWLDRGAARGGTVVTHTVLAPVAVAMDQADLLALTRLHRRPADASDRPPYQQVLAELPVSDGLMNEPAHARAALALFFGQRDRPILWMDDAQPRAIVRYLWSLSLPHWRARFSFCTLALQERTIDRQPFTFLGLPPQAQGAFHRYAGSTAWLRHGQLGHPSLAESAIVEAVYSDGADALHTLEDQCRALELPMIARPGDTPALKQFFDVRAAAGERLSAARARADLLTRLWPEIPADHGEWQRAISDWLAIVGSAPVAPKPLFELTYMASRDALWTALGHSPNLASRWHKLLTAEIARRALEARETTLTGLTGLLDALATEPARSACYLGVQRAIAASDLASASELARALVQMAGARSDARLLSAALVPLPSDDRIAAYTASVSDPDPVAAGWLHDAVAGLATEHNDPALAFASFHVRDDDMAALQAAASAVAKSSSLSALRPLIEQVAPDVGLRWCLGAAEPNWSAEAAELGAMLADRMDLSAADLLERALGQNNDNGNGIRIFARRHRWLPGKELAGLFDRHSTLAWELLTLALQSSDAVDPSQFRAALAAIPDEHLLAADIRARFAHLAADSPGAYTLAAAVGPRLLGHIAHGVLATDEAVAWLDVPMVARWLRRQSRWAIEPLFRPHPRHALAHMAEAAHQICRQTDAAPAGLLVAVQVLVRNSGSGELQRAGAALVGLLAHSLTRDAIELRADVLWAALEHRVEPELIAATFRDTYRAIVANKPVAHTRRWPKDWGWDRGKGLIHWLIDTWVARAWPAEVFIRCLGDDRTLAERAFKRARKRAPGHFWRALEAAVRQSPGLRAVWPG